MVGISPKQRRIVKAKIKGVPTKKIASIEYPQATVKSGMELVSRNLRKPNVAQYYEQSKLQALKEHNITWSRIIRPISDALEAEKQNNFTGEITPDYSMRLKASKQASELMQSKLENEEVKEFKNLPDNLSEIELQKMIFRKGS